MPLSGELIPIREPMKVWALCKGLIETVLDRFDNFERIEDLEDDLFKGHRQLWVVLQSGEVQAAVLTMINEYHGKRCGVLTHAAGHDAQDWFDIVNPIGEYFKKEGCTTFNIIGRKGWLKYLPDFKTDKVILEKKLDG